MEALTFLKAKKVPKGASGRQIKKADLRGLHIYFFHIKEKKETTLHLW